MKITIETAVKAPLQAVWQTWNDPVAIKDWNAPQDDWHTTEAQVDLREGGGFRSRIEAKDGAAGFDFAGTYTRVEPQKAIAYRLNDGREVQVEFIEKPEAVIVKETFDAETENSLDVQLRGWQAILNNFGRYVEARVQPDRP